MSPWQEWKAKNLAKQQAGIVTPTALFNPDTPQAEPALKAERLAICESCPHYLPTSQCSKCGCFMPVKAGLEHASCPVGKW
jgi:hypothetical protein